MFRRAPIGNVLNEVKGMTLNVPRKCFTSLLTWSIWKKSRILTILCVRSHCRLAKMILTARCPPRAEEDEDESQPSISNFSEALNLLGELKVFATHRCILVKFMCIYCTHVIHDFFFHPLGETCWGSRWKFRSVNFPFGETLTQNFIRWTFRRWKFLKSFRRRIFEKAILATLQLTLKRQIIEETIWQHYLNLKN